MSSIVQEMMDQVRKEWVQDGQPHSLQEMGDEVFDRIEALCSKPWAIGFRDRGMGHGDYAVVVEETGQLLVECPTEGIARHLVAVHNESLKKGLSDGPQQTAASVPG